MSEKKSGKAVKRPPTPKETIREKFGSKEALAKDLASRLDRPEGQTQTELIKRLSVQKNSTLLRLYETTERVSKAFGSKAELVTAILKKHGHAGERTDQDYQKRLMTYSLPRLLDLHGSAGAKHK